MSKEEIEMLAEVHSLSLNAFGSPLRGDDAFKPHLNCGQIRGLCKSSYITGYNHATLRTKELEDKYRIVEGLLKDRVKASVFMGGSTAEDANGAWELFKKNNNI